VIGWLQLGSIVLVRDLDGLMKTELVQEVTFVSAAGQNVTSKVRKLVRILLLEQHHSAFLQRKRSSTVTQLVSDIAMI
jgi:hypothetical protein